MPQVILQSETIQELSKTSQALASVQEEVSELRKLADTYRSENVSMFSHSCYTIICSNYVGMEAVSIFIATLPVVLYFRTKTNKNINSSLLINVFHQYYNKLITDK